MHLSHRNKTLSASLLIILSTLSAYWNLQYNSLIGYDDVKYLIENEYVRTGLSLASVKWALTATYDANWFPLTWLSHMLDMTLFGSNAFWHHLENLLLHIISALLMMSILSRLTGSIWRSTAVAMLFALHPLHVESVAWAAERKDVLSTLFFMLTIRVYADYAEQRSTRHYAAAVFFYLCGLLSKPMLVSLPFILLLLDFWPLNRFKVENSSCTDSKGKLFLEKIPFFLLSIASCILTFNVQRSGGGANELKDQMFFQNFLHALLNCMTYLRKTFWPSDLAVIYPYVHTIPTWMIAGSAFALAALTAAAVVYRNKLPYITVGWFWFLVTIAPVSGIVKIGVHSVTDRYTYIPLIGVFIVVVWLTSDILSGKRNAPVILALISAAVMTALSAVTWKQTTYWKDSITLFKHTLDVTSNNWVAHNNLGAELLKYSRTREAEWHIQEAVRLNPKSESAVFNMGQVLKMNGDRRGALRAYLKVIKLSPDRLEAYYEAGVTSFQIGEKEVAYQILALLKDKNPDMAESLRKYYILIGNITPGASR